MTKSTTFFLSVIIATVFISVNAVAQKVTVVLKDKEAFISIPISDSGVIELDKIPESITLVFPEDNPQNYTIQFNKDKGLFKVGFNCNDSDCVKLLLGDFKDNKIKLVFKDSSLVAINDRWIKPLKLILDVKKKPLIVLLSGKKAETGKPKITGEPGNPLNETGEVKPEVMLVDSAWLSNFRLPCEDLTCEPCKDKDKKDTNCKCCVTKIPSGFSKMFLNPCTGGQDKRRSNAVTPKYRIVINELAGSENTVTYLKYKRKKGYEYYTVKKMLSPLVGSEVAITVIGKKDSSYIIESSTVQYFMDYEKNFEDQVKNISGGEAKVDSVKTDSTKKDSTTLSVKDMPQWTEFLNNHRDPKADSLLVASYNSDTSLAAKLRVFQKYYSASFNDKFNQFILKQKDFVKDPLENLMDDYVANLEKLLSNKGMIDTLIARNNREVAILKDSLKILLTRIQKYPTAYWYKNHLKAIETALLRFNTVRISQGLLEQQREAFLVCLKLYVNETLGKVVPDNSKDFGKILSNMAAIVTSKEYYADFSELIKNIEIEYEKLVNPKDRFVTFTKQVKVPGTNDDEISFSVKTGGGRELLLPRNYRTSLGLKIDFSTGIFVSGLTNSDFLISQESFRYKQTKDSINPSGQLITQYTGGIGDTTGKVIRENRKLTFNTGFIIHAYTRSGTPVNFGIAAGPIINESQIQLLVGGSLMFSVGKSRLAFVGGMTFGKEKTLSEDLNKSFIKKGDNSVNSIYNSRNDLPVFYTGDGNVNSNTYLKSRKSWFLGITYNFASANIIK